jgi:hypothetical protein
MTDNHARMIREGKTVEAMIGIYCRGQHNARQALCKECRTLLDYARQRLETCPFQEGKTTCAKCPIHCYKLDMRARIRTVMRYAGPRMLYRHPIISVQHLFDGLRREPVPARQAETDRAGLVKKART